MHVTIVTGLTSNSKRVSCSVHSLPALAPLVWDKYHKYDNNLRIKPASLCYKTHSGLFYETQWKSVSFKEFWDLLLNKPLKLIQDL